MNVLSETKKARWANHAGIKKPTKPKRPGGLGDPAGYAGENKKTAVIAQGGLCGVSNTKEIFEKANALLRFGALTRSTNSPNQIVTMIESLRVTLAAALLA